MNIKNEYQKWISKMNIKNEYQKWISKMKIKNENQKWISKMNIKNEYQKWKSKTCLFLFVFLFVFSYIWIYFRWLHDIGPGFRCVGKDCRLYRYDSNTSSSSQCNALVHPPLNITGKMHLVHNCKFELNESKYNPANHCKINEKHVNNRKLYTNITHSTSTQTKYIQNIYTIYTKYIFWKNICMHKSLRSKSTIYMHAIYKSKYNHTYTHNIMQHKL
jgi:hypothetical protein